jgi:two-component system OmpR family response regulator
MQTRIIILEDGFYWQRLVGNALGRDGFHILNCHAAEQAKILLHQQPFHLALVAPVVDPQGSGLDFVRFARVQQPGIGIVVVSAQSKPIDRIVAIEMGADDYLVSPLEPRELMARLRRMSTRFHHHGQASDKGSFLFSGFTLKKASRQLIWGEGRDVPLTRSEFDLLVFLLESGNDVVSRDTLTAAIRGRTCHAYDRSVDTLISGLRYKLGLFNPDQRLIRTMRNGGYYMATSAEWVALNQF